MERFFSVKHRAVVNSYKLRMSIAYFGAPSPSSRISCLPNLVTTQKIPLYRSFTWAEYSRQLRQSSLNLFRTMHNDQNEE